VILAEVNAEGARLYRYAEGALETLEHLRAHVVTDSHDHMGSMPRQGFHTGTRGATGTDAAQRELRSGTRKMLHELARRLVTLAGAESWVVVGGTPVPAKAALSALPEALAPRTLLMPAMHIWASEAQIRDAAERGAAALQEAHDLVSVSAAIERAAQAGRGATGIDATLGALSSGAVDDLYLSDQLLERSPGEAEAAVRAALGHGARPQVVGGDAADLLNEMAHGIAARLRYVSVVA
jgi:stalled ribosome rescue protein Dom34